MYMLTSLGQPQAKTDCSGWESDPESFIRVIAKHHISTELGRTLSPTRGPYKVTAKTWGVTISRQHCRVCEPR